MSKYKVGDKVRIVSEWGKGCRQNSDGKMDKWLGKTMTIRKVTPHDYYLMEEDKAERDGIGWCWFDACIAGLANKFNVGERYKVDYDGIPEAGNIIEITGIGKGYRIYYKTIKGNHDRYYDKFDERSNFANSLIPVTEQSDSTKKIVITTDGKTTTAKMYDGKSCIKVSEARCCPSDAFDFQTGAEIAFNRLFEKSHFWEEFKAGKLCVKVDEENIPEFLKSCENNRITWHNGKNATEFNPFEAQKDIEELLRIVGLTLYEKYVYLTVVDGGMMHCEQNKNGLTEVEFSPEQFDWNAFKSQNLAIIVTRENIKSFLSEAEKHGCKWRSGKKPTEWNPAEEYELEKTYLYGIKNRDDFGEFGWCTVRPFKKVCVVEW